MKKRLFTLASLIALFAFAASLVSPVASAQLWDVDDSNTKVLLHMNGADASTTFTDESSKVWTAAGNAQIDTAQSKFGGASGLFDGSGDYVETPDHADFDIGAGEFTVDLWFNVGGGNGTVRFLFGQSDSGATDNTRPLELRMTTGNVLEVRIHDGSNKLITGTTAFATAGWHHAAVVRTGNTIKLFVDGVKEGTDLTSVGTLVNSANKFSIGRTGELASLYFNGWIDEFRFSKGVARWTENFTPPSAEYAPATPTPTNTNTPTNTPTDTPTPTNTATDTPTATNTATDTPVVTATFTDTPIVTETFTLTPSITSTITSTITDTATSTPDPCAYAATLSSSTWTNTSGTNADICTDNGVRMVWREPGSGSEIFVLADFTTDPSTLYTIRFNGYHNGDPDDVVLECHYGESSTIELATLTSPLADDETITVSLPQECNDGSPEVHFHQTAGGNASHYLRVDQLVLDVVAATPVAIPTYYFDGGISYGELSITITLSLLCLVFVIFILIWLVLPFAQRKGGGKP